MAETTGNPGELSRTYNYPALGPVTGYNHPIYGQSGLEASLDPILRGLEGNDPVIIEWHHLLYGQPPPGLDVRLTLDMELQKLADDFLSGQQGTLILLNAETGEILVMSSHPTFDPNLLDDTWDELFQNIQAPLINRVTQGIYPTGDLADQPFLQAASNPEVGPVALRLPQANNNLPEDASPLDVAFSAASLSNAGVRPAPRLALSYQHPEDGWKLFPLLGTTVNLLTPEEVNSQIINLASQDFPIWQYSTIVPDKELTWFLAGTLSEVKPPVTLVLILENENLPLAEEIGEAIMMEVINR